MKSLRPKQLEEYQAAFEAAETSKASSARSAAAATQSRKTNAGNSRNTDNVPARRGQTQLPEEMMDHDHAEGDADDDEESVDEYTCPFCGIVDEHFDSDKLDEHFWAACRMLTPCKMCGQVIEISGLNEHLLIECELKRNHKECTRCGEAITTKFYDKHVTLNDCPKRPHPKQANRCPLCHEDIAPGKQGWRVHLIDERCQNNPRS